MTMTSMVNNTLNKRRSTCTYGPNKRQKMTRQQVIYRMSKPEMKHLAFPITHVSTLNSNTNCFEVAQGSTNLARVGNKIKIWNVQAVLAFDQAIRVDLLLPVDQGATAPGYNYNLPEDRDEFTLLGTYILNPQNGGNTQMGRISHRLPMGLVTRYTGSTGASCNKNGIIARITSPVNTATVNGYFQIWYTDA